AVPRCQGTSLQRLARWWERQRRGEGLHGKRRLPEGAAADQQTAGRLHLLREQFICRSGRRGRKLIAGSATLLKRRSAAIFTATFNAARSICMTAPMANLSIKGVSVTYPALQQGGSVVALQNVNLEIESGDFVVALGASGCGKTTLLNVLAGFLSPTQGELL